MVIVLQIQRHRALNNDKPSIGAKTCLFTDNFGPVTINDDYPPEIYNDGYFRFNPRECHQMPAMQSIKSTNDGLRQELLDTANEDTHCRLWYVALNNLDSRRQSLPTISTSNGDIIRKRCILIVILR